MILTAAGLVAIENIKAGNKFVSTNPDGIVSGLAGAFFENIADGA